MNKKQRLLFIAILIAAGIAVLPSCKSCNKGKEAETANSDTVPIQTVAPSANNINLPHADTSLIPVLSAVLDQAFDASAKKDYGKLASLLVYRGVDSTRFGYDVFNAKNNYERGVTRITADMFNKWNSGIESRDYSRVFELDLPDGRKMPMLEVIFVSKKTITRKFFGFLNLKGGYKIGDITSNLGEAGN